MGGNVPPAYTVADYLTGLRAIRATGSATAETSYYPPLDRLLNAAGQSLNPPVLFSTQLRNSGAGMPDGGFFPQPKRQRRNAELALLLNPERGAVEIKPADYSLDNLAAEPQTLGYLRQYGLVLITNLREFRLLQLAPSGAAQTLERYVLANTPSDLWQAPLASFARHNTLLPDFLARVMLYRAPLVQPKDVAWLLASYAREARARAEDHPLASFDAVKKALQESLGMRFEGEKGEHFFRSTLVQTLFYGIFSAWVLWHRAPEGRVPGAHFDWRLSAYYLSVPVLRKLFSEVSERGAVNSIQLQQVLDLAGEALNRVQPAFFDTFREDEAVAYFYEPFLEAFDPQLRKDLGVWYTPRQIVDYMVERVDHLLRTQLNQPLGLASPAVRILDPCCGTGAYLTAVLHRIHRTLLEEAGDDTALVPNTLREAALTRVFGFEIMPAPFVIAHLQIASLLETAHAPLTDQHRAGVYLTNALTGWVPERHPQSAIFREFEKEREDSEHIKQEGTILVILGNPPYNGYAGIAQIEEERDLTTAYREPIPGLPAPHGQGLNDLYVRFFRIAERRIVGDANVHGNQGGCGIVSIISNNNWLDGLSHVSMRKKYIDTFQSIYIDNLNGDKYRTGKTTPEGLPDPSAFSTPQNREGIQVGTAIATLVRTGTTRTVGQGFSPDNKTSITAEALAPEVCSWADALAPQIHLRDLWGTGKLSQLQRESRNESEPTYTALTPAPTLGNPFAHRAHSAAYTLWPRLPELFPTSFPGIKTSRDPLLVDIDRDELIKRIGFYLDIQNSDREVAESLPIAMTDTTRFSAKTVRKELVERRKAEILLAIEGGNFKDLETAQKNFTQRHIEPYCYRPYDVRWLYWESHTKLLDEKRLEYWEAMVPKGVAIASAQSNRRSFDPPCVTSSLASLHLIERTAILFPLQVEAETLPGVIQRQDNISPEAALRFPNQTGARDLFFHALSTMHAPAYRAENAGALLGDWPRIPLPATADLLAHSAGLGRRLAELLDAESTVNLTAEWSFLGALKLPLDPNLEEALKLTAGWGHKGQGSTVMPGRGLAPERLWSEPELAKLSALAATQSLTAAQALTLLGQTSVSVYLNGDALWSAIPINVWNYTLGGYQVLKKWLSYREFTAEPTSPLLHRALRPEEAAYFSQVVRRIAAILLLGPALDQSYQAILPTATGLPSNPTS
jgi:Type ISP C-terminal specificity domain/N-6 DNA Methylase